MDKNGGNKKLNSIVIFVLVGILLILFSIIWEAQLDEDSYIQEILTRVLGHLGMGAFVIGILGILIDTKHWTEYFKQRLADIVIDKKYMQNLTPAALIDLQTEIFKVYFKDTNIGEEGGFLKFHQDQIQEIIGSPFRTNVEDDYSIRYNDSKDKLIVHEVLIWYCKSNLGSIQKEIKWLSAEDEFDEINHGEVRLNHESFVDEMGSGKEKVFRFDEFKEEWKRDNGRGFIFPLNEYETLDNLKVTIVVEYTIPWFRFIAWRMAHLTKGLSLTIRYPEDLSIATEIFSRKNFEVRHNEKGYYKLVTQGWVMPNEGIPFQFIK